MKGLVPLLEKCEGLEELRIVLDATVVDNNSFEKPGQVFPIKSPTYMG